VVVLRLPQLRQGRVDRLGRLGVPLLEQVGVDLERDVRVGVPEAIGDHDDVDTGSNKLAGVRVPQSMERDVAHSDRGGYVRPFGAEGAGRLRAALEGRGHEVGIRQLPQAELQPHRNAAPEAKHRHRSRQHVAAGV